MLQLLGVWIVKSIGLSATSMVAAAMAVNAAGQSGRTGLDRPLPGSLSGNVGCPGQLLDKRIKNIFARAFL